MRVRENTKTTAERWKEDSGSGGSRKGKREKESENRFGPLSQLEREGNQEKVELGQRSLADKTSSKEK